MPGTPRQHPEGPSEARAFGTKWSEELDLVEAATEEPIIVALSGLTLVRIGRRGAHALQ